MSYAHEMKSMNCISHTGRMPMWAAPAAAPTIAASEIGVSITRASPNRAASPSVTLNAPPYAPMSSPRQKTFGSRSISSNSASRIASRYVVSAIVCSPRRRPLVRRDRRSHALSEPERRNDTRLRVDANEGVGRLRHRRRVGLVRRLVDLLPYALIDRMELGIRHAFASQHRDISVDRIVRLLPALDLAWRHIGLVVVLRVPLAAIGDELNERWATPLPCAIDGTFGDRIGREHIVAISLLPRNPVTDGLVLEITSSGLLRQRCRVRVAIVLDDHHQRALLDRGEIDPFVKGSGRCGTVTHVDQPHAILSAHLERQRDTGHDRNHVAQLRDLADKTADEIPIMDVELAATRGRVALSHVLANDLQRLSALHQHGTQVTNQWREDITLLSIERVSAPHGVRFLTERPKEAADDFGLTIQIHQSLFQ